VARKPRKGDKPLSSGAVKASGTIGSGSLGMTDFAKNPGLMVREFGRARDVIRLEDCQPSLCVSCETYI